MAVTVHGGGEEPHRLGRLLRYDAVAQRRELGGAPQSGSGGHPAVLKALHPFHEPWREAPRVVGRRRCRTGEALPPGDGVAVPPPSPGAFFESAEVSKRVRGGSAVRRAAVARPLSCAAAEGSVRSPLPWRWRGEPLMPSDAFGVGSSHSTSSARFGPCPPSFRCEGCWLPPLEAMLLVGVFSNGLSSPGSEEEPLPSVRGADVAGA